MSLTLAELFASPDHYLHSFADGAAVFVPMDRDAYHRSVFLDDRIDPARSGTMRLPLEMLVGQAPQPNATGWIFHVAHCGSTLLARALDELGSNLILREPLALRQLALEPALNREVLAVELAMLSKAYDPAAPTLVKANVPVNFMLDAIAAQQRQAPALLLYLGLEDYLCAILRSDNHRKWLRGVTAQLAHHLDGTADQPDAILAAKLWHAQIARFAAVLQEMPLAHSLDAEAFYAEPVEIIGAAAQHFGIKADMGTIEDLVGGALFQTYSKRPGVAFSNADRLARRDAARAELSGELTVARRWLEDTGRDSSAALARLSEQALL
jgi:hypothetical protein